jgi:peptidoglycan-associated lipoprotein
MKHARAVAVALMAVFALGACSKKQPPAEPAPAQPTETRPAPPPPAARDDSAERAAAERERIRSVLQQMIHFEFDRFDIRGDAQGILNAKVEEMRRDPAIRLRIDGHADERGSLEYNLTLGMRRADAARQYMVGYGLEAMRFETFSFGEERPLDAASNEAAWARNRRAEFSVTAGPVAGRD